MDQRGPFQRFIGTASIDLEQCAPFGPTGAPNPAYCPPGSVPLDEARQGDVVNPFIAPETTKAMRDALKARMKAPIQVPIQAMPNVDTAESGVPRKVHDVQRGRNEGTRIRNAVRIEKHENFGDKDDSDPKPEWMEDRKILDKEFESSLPFESMPYGAVPVFRGSDFDAFATGSRKVHLTH